MSDRVQALKEGVDERIQIAREEGLQSQVWKRQADIDEFIRFLASQELGWAEELVEFPNMTFYCKNCDKMVTNTQCNITGEGAVKFVPLEIKDEPRTNQMA